MTIAHDRAARRERQAAALLGSTRVHRARYERAPDVVPVRLADGTLLVPEAKTRGKLPRWLVGAVAQARRYLPGAVPVVVLSELGGEPLALVPLRDLARMLGLPLSSPPAAQLSLAPRVGLGCGGAGESPDEAGASGESPRESPDEGKPGRSLGLIRGGLGP